VDKLSISLYSHTVPKVFEWQSSGSGGGFALKEKRREKEKEAALRSQPSHRMGLCCRNKSS